MYKHWKNVLVGAFVVPGCLAIMPAMGARWDGSSNPSNQEYSSNNRTGNGGGLENSTTDFSATNMKVQNNTASENGGGIWNNGDMDLRDVIVTGNTAGMQGGGIYNRKDVSDVILYGNNIFSGNVDANGSNDIYNDKGTVTVADGKTTMDGGIAGNGTLQVSTGAELVLNDAASIVQKNINLYGIITAVLNESDNYRFTATNPWGGDGKLVLTMPEVGTYKIFGNENATLTQEDIILSSNGIIWNSRVYNVAFSADGKDIIASMKSVSEIAGDDLSMESANVISVLANSSSDLSKQLVLALQDELANGNSAAVEDATSAIQPETQAVAQSVALTNQDMVVGLASSRMASTPSIGRSGGDYKISTLGGDWKISTNTGIWAQGLYNKAKRNGAFNGYTRGIAAGIDTTINKNVMMGVGYTFASSDVAGKTHDTDIDTSTLFIYGQYKPSRWYFNGVANYSWSDYSEKANVLGILKTADYDAETMGLRVAAGYDYKNGVVPEFGLRYAHIETRNYTDSFQIKNHLDYANFLTADLGAKFAIDIKSIKYLPLRPQMYVGTKFDIVSDKQVAHVTMPGADSYSITGERLARLAGDLGLGLSTKYKGVDVSLMYDLEVRQDYTSQTGRIKLRYEF